MLFEIAIELPFRFSGFTKRVTLPRNDDFSSLGKLNRFTPPEKFARNI